MSWIKCWLAVMVCSGSAVAAPTTGPTTMPATKPMSRAAGIAIAPVVHPAPVDFQKEVLPILASNCLACHNKTKAKAGLILETPADMLKGGDTGPAIVAKKGAESLLLLAAAHQGELAMPPKDNKVAAVDLTPQQLGLIKLWIDQGATGSVNANVAVKWQEMQDSFAPVYGVGVSGDGQWAAFGRGRELMVYHVPTKQVVRLIDPALTAFGKNLAHRDLTRSVAMSADGNWIASGAYGEVKLWKRVRGGEKALIAVAEPIRAMAASGDGKLVAIAGDGGVIQLFENGTKKTDLAGHAGAVLAAKFSTDGAKLVSAGADKTIRVWDVAGGKEMAHAALAEVSGVAWVNGTQVVSAAGKRVVIWNMPAAGKNELVIVKELPSQEANVRTLDASGGLIVLGGEDGAVRVWNAETAAAVASMKHDAPVTAVAIRGDGKRFASAGGNYARMWDEKGKMVAEMKGSAQLKEVAAKADRELAFAAAELNYHKGAVAAADKEQKAQTDRLKKATDAEAAAKKTLEEKQKALATATEAKTKAEAEKQAADKIAAVTKAVTDADAAVKAAEKPARLAGDEVEVVKKTLGKANEALTSAQAALAAAETEQKKCEAAVPVAKKAAGDSAVAVKSVAFSADGLVLASGGDDKLVQTWSAENGVAMEEYRAMGAVTSIAFGLGSVIASTEKTIARWTTSSEWVLDKTLPLAGQPPLMDCVNALDFSADGKLLAAGGGVPTRGSEIRVWTVADGQLRHRFDEAHSDSVFGVKFSADGKRLASGAADRFARIFDLEKSVLVRSLEGHTHHVLGVAWKRDGRTLVTAGADNVVKVWDPNSGDKRKNIEGWGKEVTSITFVGDTDQIMASCGDGRVRITKSDGTDVRAWAADGDFVLCAAASADGSIVVSGGQDGYFKVWNGTNGTAISSYPEK
jgi:WD40 repeat protein